MFGRGGFNWAPRIGSIRGMDIRLHLTLVLIVVFWLIEGAVNFGSGGLVRAAVLTAALGVVIVWHELGHAWAARRSGLRVESILLWPLGGECQISGAMPGPKTDIFVSLAGPAAHLLLVAISFVPIYIVRRFSVGDVLLLEVARDGLVAAWSLALWILIFNLIPAFPLDGGQALRGMLTFRLGEVQATRVAARIGQGFAALYAIYGLYRHSMLLVGLAIYIFISAEQELRAVLYSGAAYDPNSRDPFFRSLGIGQHDWAREAARRDEARRESGLVSRLKTRWQLWRLTRATERHQRMRAEVDRILEKVSREGLPALTRREKRILKQASQEYRESR